MTLDATTVVGYLERRGVLPAGSGAVATSLEGGVSNDVFAVRGAGVEVVVKQALPRLRVADEWLAKVERAATEGEALRLAGSLAPGLVPPVFDLDPDAGALTIALAPPGWSNWKEGLLTGRASSAVAARLGEALALWHAGTAGDPAVVARFDDVEAFIQLRVDPYHRIVAERVPEVAHQVGALVERMLATKRCLVHGDFSPKNVLVEEDGDGLWVIDWEVAHTGDPAFDVAFLLNHLLLKAVHRPESRDQYRACADSFLAAYDAGVGPEFAGGQAHLVAHVGCLLLARSVGKSPAEYLTLGEREVVRRLGTRTLLDPPSRLAAIWGAV